MAQKWREAEKTVARIEKLMAGNGVTVASPGFVEDRVTGKKREVDVLITRQVGSSQINIAVECRRRSRAADVIWIEQIAQKNRDLRLAKTIAVTNKAFSDQARLKAEHEGIELRLLSELSENVVREWLAPSFSAQIKSKVLMGCLLDPVNSSDAELFPVEKRGEDFGKRKIIRSNTGDFFSVLEMLDSLEKIDPRFEDQYPRDNGSKTVIWKLELPEHDFSFGMDNLDIPLKAMVFKVKLVSEFLTPPEETVVYQTPELHLISGAEYVVEHQQLKKRMGIYRDEQSGQISIGCWDES